MIIFLPFYNQLLLNHFSPIRKKYFSYRKNEIPIYTKLFFIIYCYRCGNCGQKFKKKSFETKREP